MSQIISFNNYIANNNIIENITAAAEVLEPMPKAHINPFENRRVPWSGIGVDIREASCVDEAVAMCGLNWELGLGDIYDGAGHVIPHYKAITRADSGKVFGVTKDKYKPIQNADAFGFADILRTQGATFEKGGCYKDGEKIWFLMKLPSRSYGGDQHDLYMFLMNGNNGKQSLFAAFTTIRAMCCNMAHLVSKNSTFKVSLQHRGNIEGKMLEAQEVMAGAQQYFDGLAHTMEELRNINLTRAEMGKIIEGLFPYAEDATDRVKRTATEKRNQLINILYNAPDLQNEGMNGLRLVHALTDYESHAEPARHPEGFAENRLMNLATQPMLADKVVEILTA